MKILAFYLGVVIRWLIEKVVFDTTTHLKAKQYIRQDEWH